MKLSNPLALKFLPVIMDSLIKTPVSGLNREQVEKYLQPLPIALRPEAADEITNFVVSLGKRLGVANVGALFSSPQALAAIVPQLMIWKDTLVEPSKPQQMELVVQCRHCGGLNPFIDGSNTVDLSL